MQRLPIGQRIRNKRKELGLTQSALAQQAGISVSYLNLIEHNKRMIGGALLNRLAAQLGVETSHLSDAEDGPLVQQTLEMARSQSLTGLDEKNVVRLVAENPDWARALLALHRKYQDTAEHALSLSDRLSQDPMLHQLSHAILTQTTSIRSFAEILGQFDDLNADDQRRFSGIVASQSGQLGSSVRAMIELLGSAMDAPEPLSPEKEVDDFIIAHRNYFDELESATRSLRDEMGVSGKLVATAIAGRLSDRHGIDVRFTDGDTREPSENVFWLDTRAPEASIRFRMAKRLIEIEAADLLERLVRDSRLTNDDARSLGRRALASYGAGALLFPYEEFLKAAEHHRYDIDRLSAAFGSSFEQTAHRLVTLQRPKAPGVPFAFLRTDPAGNISKPFSIPGLPMPRFGGACPLWAIYAAFSEPGRIVSQLATTQLGERYLFVARTVDKRTAGFGEAPTRYSVMIGCDSLYMDRLVYGDRYATGQASLETPVGFSCRLCERHDCRQRAQPSLLAAGNRQNSRKAPVTGAAAE